MSREVLFLADEAATLEYGARAANQLKAPSVIYLTGELGAGKTTLVRGLLHALGHQGAVKSPTFTLVEPYPINDIQIYHFDLYRLSDAEELYAMGIEDYFTSRSICLIEWPERGVGVLPPATMQLELQVKDGGRQLSIIEFS